MRRGIASFLSADLVLTIGLPFLAAMDQRSLVGTIAHELGHFRQGAAMRLTYTVRRINGWFARVVYERDRFAEWLTETSRDVDVRVGVVLYAARLGVWVSRVILGAFMLIGHALSCLLMRRMEHDADRVAAAVAGSDASA